MAPVAFPPVDSASRTSGQSVRALRPFSEGPDDVVAGAFAALLAPSRPQVRGGGLAVESEASASQMFEPPATDAHEQRQNALKADDGAGRAAASAADRFDAASVQARREAQASAGPAPGADGGVGTGSSPDRSYAEQPLGAGARDGQPADASGKEPAVQPTGESAEGHAARRIDSVSSRPPLPSRSDASVSFNASSRPAGETIATAAVAPIGRAGSPDASPGQTAALIGRVLGSGTTAGAESARAVMPATATEGAPTRTGTPDGTGRTALKQGQTDSSTGRTTDGAAARSTDFDRLIRSLRFQTGTHRSSARLQLDPPALGRMLVDVRMTGDELRIDVRTETEAARTALLERVAQLRAALAQAGIHVDRFDVTSDLPGQHGSPFANHGFFGEGSGAAAEGGHRASRERVAPTAGAEQRGSDRTGEEQLGDAGLTVAGNTRLDIRI